MKNLTDKIIYVALGALILMAFKPAANPEPTPQPIATLPSQPSEIKVTGSAEMLVPPDKISVDINYREYWYTTYKSKSTIEEIEKKLVNALNKAGVDSSEIQINSAYAWKHNWNYWHYWHDYYRNLIQKNMTIQVTSSAQLNKVIKQIKGTSIRKQGIVNIQLNGSSNEKLQEYRKLVKEQAIKAAQDKADYLLGAVGEKRGRVVTISELSDPQITTTTHNSGYWGNPWYYDYWGGYGYGSSTVTSSPNVGMSNVSVNVPSVGGGGHAQNGEQDLSMKPIKLRYEIEAVFSIEG